MTPFDKHRASVFVITSPFQALCAFATINQLEIEDYLLIALLPDNEVRNDQLLGFLKQQHLHYITIETNSSPRKIRLLQLKALVKQKNRYSRLFVGDFRNMTELYVGCGYVSDKSDVVYLDDGNFTVSVLKNIVSFHKTGKYLKLLSRLRKINLFTNLLTIYSDIPNNKYCIEPLYLNYAMNDKVGKEFKTKGGVYIVGTNMRLYCKSVGITEDQYINQLDVFLKQLKKDFNDEELVFIPHGRDTSEYAKELCNNYNIEFRPSETMIELALLDLPKIPIAIYGNTSSALFNLKKMFPDTVVYNVLYEPTVKGAGYQVYSALSEYYESNGIKLLKVSLS